jgi:small neutral amino acid transporter SnatA (MarC family)
MTRALRLLAAGDLQGSLRMHPLALPALLAAGMLAASTVWASYALGTPLVVHESRLGRGAITAAAIVYALVLLLWVARWLGCFGGPVPVG